MAFPLLMAVILVVVDKKGIRDFGGIDIGGMLDLVIFFFAFVSGASLNSARSLAPCFVVRGIGNLRLCWNYAFIGTTIISGTIMKILGNNCFVHI